MENAPASDRHRFEHLTTVGPEDIDELEHVNNAVYLQYVEAVGRAHAEHFGLTLEGFRACGVVPVIRRHVVTYHRPALLGDTLRVSTRVTQMDGPRAERHNQVRRADTNALLVDVVTQWVWLDPVSGRPKRVPRAVQEAFGFLAEDQDKEAGT